MTHPKLFSLKAKLIWDNGSRTPYNHYQLFKKEFTLTQQEFSRLQTSSRAFLNITADAFYMATLNDMVVGHGPAKSAKGRRSVDTLPVIHTLQPGKNILLIRVHSVGRGTCTYELGNAGLIYELDLGKKKIPSDTSTLTTVDKSYSNQTVRRWMLPCIEDVDAQWQPQAWEKSTVVTSSAKLYPRRVALPSYEAILPECQIINEEVTYPTFSLAGKMRPYLATKGQELTHNIFKGPALIVFDIISPVQQKIQFTPAMGADFFNLNGKSCFLAHSWGIDDPKSFQKIHTLKKGSNRGVFQLSRGQIEDFDLCGFTQKPVQFKNPFGSGLYQIIPVDDPELVKPPLGTKVDWNKLSQNLPKMDPSHGRFDVNPHILAHGAKTVQTFPVEPALTPHPAQSLSFNKSHGNLWHRQVVDLGKVVAGHLKFSITGPAGAQVNFSLMEGYDQKRQTLQWPSTCNNSIRYTLKKGFQSFESFFFYGGRYVVIDYHGSAPSTIEGLRLLSANCGTVPKGSFTSSDPLLNEIYDICVQTIISSTDDTFTDCPLFEQVNWNYDNRTAALGDMAACGSDAIIQNSILLCQEDPDRRDLVNSHYPSSVENIIPMWSMHWMMWSHDYYLYSGDLSFIRKTFPQIQRGIEKLLSQQATNGLIATGEQGPQMELWHFLEWGHGRDDNHSINTAEQGGMVGTLTAGIELAKALKKTNLVKRWRRERTALIKTINKHLWDKKKQAFVDSLHEDGNKSEIVSEATNAVILHYRAANSRYRQVVLKKLIKTKSNLLPYASPYGMYYVLETLAAEGEVDLLFKLIKQRWGDMVREGDKTTWETFKEYGGWNDFPARSRCHPFAAYILKYYVEFLFGIKSRKPGMTSLSFNPNPPRGVSQVKGRMPTPHGTVDIVWKKSKKEFLSQLKTPSVVRIIKTH